MFGLSKREQRWKAEEKAALALLGLLSTVAKATAEVEVARANTEANNELARMRLENEQLKMRLQLLSKEPSC